MALTLYVDGPRWRAHLDRVVAGHPGIVPVVKGNGYGFGLARLLAECARLAGAGVTMVAVGTYAEAPVALAGFPGDVLVLEPYRGAVHGAGAGGGGGGALRAPALVHTVTSAAELERLVGVL
ncbi:MAG: alanine racemase, partial [Lapillicoccus sp.]